jgi:hypothetical protein
MRPLAKIGLIALGYIAAFAVASGVTAVRVALTSGPDAQASSGMYAAGDAFLWLNVFGICALVPTVAGLYLLRPYRRFWELVGFTAVVVAITGVAAAALYALGRAGELSVLAVLAALSPLRMLVAPMCALGFLVCALVSPPGVSRIALLSAACMEVGVSAYAGVVWFVPMFLGGGSP